MKYLARLFAIIFTITILSSCDDDDPVVVNEEEVITTVNVTLTPQGGGDNITLQYQDLDGDGPNEPTISVSGNLTSGATYTGSIELLNETEDPAEDITAEIREEDEEHQFFFSLPQDIGTITYNDQDSNNNPIGLSFTLNVSNPLIPPTSGDLTVTLRHEPNKTATGVQEGDITNAGGETDVVATFTVTIGSSIR